MYYKTFFNLRGIQTEGMFYVHDVLSCSRFLEEKEKQKK
jgi:hypothetical protein